MPRLFARALILLILAGCQQASQRDAITPRIPLGECERPALAAATAIVRESRCGSLRVPEDPARPDGRQIDLHLMVIPAVNPRPAPDPIFFLAGGPGQAATEIGPLVVQGLATLRKDRAIVLVDQRGTGGSSPLDCDVEAPDYLDEDLSLQHLAELQLEMVETCLAAFDPSLGAPDPRYYTTPIAMDDLESVREALGFEEINIIGGSYGTRAALVYLRRHGEHVRAVVLDAVVPLTMRIPMTMIADAGRALERLLSDCERASMCAQTYPELRAHLAELVQRLRDRPESLDVTDPLTGEAIGGTMFARSLMMLVRAALYSADLSALLPLAIERAYEGDYQPLTTMGAFFGTNATGLSIGMFLAVMCSEDMGAEIAGEPAARSSHPLFGDELAGEFERLCGVWPKGAIAPDYFRPVTSDRPVLLLSGELDPVTPPRWGEEAARTLANSRHLSVPGAGHGTLLLPCMRNAITSFIDDPVPARVEDRCTGRMQRPAFFYSKAGPVRAKGDD